MTARAAVAVTGILLLALTGCSGGPMETPSNQTSRPPFRTAPSSPAGTPVTVPTARWSAIERDLRDRGVEAAPVLVSAEAVTWPNGALGCPQPGQVYTQALIDGMRVVVTADGHEYDYRFGRTDSPVLCEHGTPAAGRP